MDEEQKKWKRLALTYGFSDGAVMRTSDMFFVEDYLQYCVENTCGNYGKNPACPPLCGEVQKLKEKVLQYRYGYVLQSTSPCDDFQDKLLMKQLKIAHNQLTMEVRRELPEHGAGTDVISAGPYMSGTERFSCLSAYCIDAARLAESCGMIFFAGLDQVSFYSVILMNRPEL